MAIKQGDFLLVNYTLKIKESGETVDTTIDSVAKDAKIHRVDGVYQPKFVVLGEEWLPKGLEESIVGMEPGTKSTVELAPEKGYGARDPGKMRLIPLRRFREKTEREAVPGQQVEFDGRRAVVRAVGAGRVQVDYNHPLAGRTLVYDVSVERVLDEPEEKILSLISRRVPEVEKEKFKVEKGTGELTVEIPEEAFDLSGLQVAKRSITADLQKYFPDLEAISFKEIFRRTGPSPAGPSETGEPEETKAGKSETAEEKPAKEPDKPRAEKRAGLAKKPAAKRAATSRKTARKRTAKED